MAKKIFASENELSEFLQSSQQKLSAYISQLAMYKFQTDDKRAITLTFTPNEIKDAPQADLVFTAAAWAKMYALVTTFDSEVEWHGVVDRTSPTSFLVKDILIFPHEVTGASVVSDQKKYEEWLDSLDDETFNHLRFHGHSHVNMGCTPSVVDMDYRKRVIDNFGTPSSDMDFYIFLITNKRGEITAEIYDLKNNALYTKCGNTKEINIDVDCGTPSLSEFVKQAREVVKPKAATPPPQSVNNKQPVSHVGYGGYSGYDYHPPRRDAKSMQQKSIWDDMEDDDDYGYCYRYNK